MKTIVRAVAIISLLAVVVALGQMVFPLIIVGVLGLLAYGIGKASRWGWR
jgi:hypothetical protein